MPRKGIKRTLSWPALGSYYVSTATNTVAIRGKQTDTHGRMDSQTGAVVGGGWTINCYGVQREPRSPTCLPHVSWCAERVAA